MENEIRNFGVDTLKKFVDGSLVEKLENEIFIYCKSRKDEFSYLYKYAIYNTIFTNHDEKVLWNSKSFDELRQIEEEQDKFIIQPFEIVEGITQCKCGSKKVFSYSKQTRGGDEATSTFNECAKCKSKWMYNG